MSEEQKKSIILINALLCKKFNIIPSTVTLSYHCWVKSTQCPGAKFFGGISKATAEKNFIPLIKKSKMDQIELEQSLKLICNKTGLDFEHWYEQATAIKWLDVAFTKSSLFPRHIYTHD